MKALKGKILLAFGGAILGFMCVEFFFAIFSPQPDFYFFDYAPGGYIVHKPHFRNTIAQVSTHTKTASSSESQFGNPERTIKQYLMPLRTNNAGFRSDEPVSYENTSGRYRILHLGDSLGFGFPLAPVESYAGRIETLIPGIEVLNASTVFTHTARLLDYYQKEGYKYKPDMVLLQLTMSFPNQDYLWLDSFGKNQLELSVIKGLGGRDAVKSFITTDEAGIEQLSWTYTGETKHLFETLRRKLNPTRFPYHHLHIARFLHSMSAVLANPIDAIVRGYLTRVGPLTESYQKEEDGLSDYQDIMRQPGRIHIVELPKNFGLRFTRVYLETFRTMLTATRTPLVLIIIPNRIGCQGGTYNAWETLLTTLPENEYHVINFYPDFCDAAAKKPREEFYLAQEFHLNAAGHALIAERVAEEVSRLKEAGTR